MKSKNQKIKIYHSITIALTLLFILLGIFRYTHSFVRIKETTVDLWYSLKYYFLNLIYFEADSKITVCNVSSVGFDYVFPIDWDTFKETVALCFSEMFTAENFSDYLLYSSTTFLLIYTFIVFFILIFIMCKMIIGGMVRSENHDYAKDSKPLVLYKRIENFFLPVKRFIVSFKDFCIKRPYCRLWLLIWLYNLNIYTIVGEFFAYLFYSVASFDFSGLYIQVYKLFLDSAITFSSLPWYIWLVISIVIIGIWRKRIAFRRLNHMENYNTGFVKSLPTVNVIYGLMGGGKGQVMTDMVLTTAKIFRSDCKDTMRKFDLMFPYFHWIILEKDILRLINTHRIYGLATIEDYIGKRRRLFECAVSSFSSVEYCRSLVWGYDYIAHGVEYDNNLYIINIFDAIKEYAQAYYIYRMIELNISNYAIRSDGILDDIGNFPLWDYDFFGRKSGELDKISTYGKILDQDILRKGKKVKTDNPFSDTLEFGIVVMTELDKERGNQYVTNEMKAKSDETNQKNDLFNYGLKLDRHSSTVDYKHYMKIYFDLQRINSTNADLQECGQHLGVGEKDKNLLAMPCFFIEEFLYGLFADRFLAFYDEYRFYHGDNTLFMYLIKKVCGGFINYYRNTYNLFGYDIHHLAMENVSDGSISKHPYYLTYKKNHARRYHTDSLVDYFRKSALKKSVGMIDYPEYSGVKATKEDFSKQNSYFYMNLENIFDNDKENN